MRLLFAVCLVVASSLAVGPWSDVYNFDSNYKFQWALSDDQTEVLWKLDVAVVGWIGIGISPGLMDQSDVVMSYIDSGNNAVISDRYVRVNYVEPDPNEQQDVFVVGFNQTRSPPRTVIVLRRKLDTGDQWDRRLVLNTTMTMVWSYNRDTTDTRTQHTVSNSVKVPYGNVTENTGRNLTVTSTLQARVAVDGLNYVISWLIEIPVRITFNVSVRCTGWVGLGISPHANMIDADIATMRVAGGGAGILADGWSSHFALPDTDAGLGGSSDYNLLAFSQDALHSNYTFWRYLDTNDTYDQVIANKFLKVIWSYNSDNNDVSKKHSYKGAMEINFFTGAFQPISVDPLLTAHGVMMALSWIVLVILSIMIARYGKESLGVWWFHWHRLILALVAIMVTVAFAFAVSATSYGHFSSGHRVLGLIIFILMYLQIVLGWLADRMYDKNRTEVPIFPDKVHWWSGRFLLLLAIANVYYGMSELSTAMVFYILITAFLFAAFAFVVIKEFTTKSGSAHFIVHAIVKRPSRRKQFAMPRD